VEELDGMELPEMNSVAQLCFAMLQANTSIMYRGTVYTNFSDPDLPVAGALMWLRSELKKLNKD